MTEEKKEPEIEIENHSKLSNDEVIKRAVFAFLAMKAKKQKAAEKVEEEEKPKNDDQNPCGKAD